MPPFKLSLNGGSTGARFSDFVITGTVDQNWLDFQSVE